MEATFRPVGNLPGTKHVDLIGLEAGCTVEIATRNSKYWVTITNIMVTRGRRQVTGVSLMTDSMTFGQVTRPPNRTIVDRVIVVGQKFHMGLSPTTTVVDIRVF